MKYSYNCPAGDKMIEVEAMTDDEAVEKIMEEAKKHKMEVHPEMEGTDEEMEKMIREGMIKEE